MASHLAMPVAGIILKNMKILIISSKGHWVHGWFTSPSDLRIGVEVLKKAGFEVLTTEVEDLAQLNSTLDKISSDTLIWANAYFVNDGEKLVWLNDCIEARNLPYVGSNAQTLKDVLKKGQCQSILKNHQIPIPDFCITGWHNILEIEDLIFENNIKIPCVLKPTTESGSIGVCKADNLDEAREHAYQILQDFPKSNVIIEDFLPSDDITCGYLEMGHSVLLLPTSYIVKSASGKNNILQRKERLRAWDDKDKMQPPVKDASILEQLKVEVPLIAKVLNIQGITRIDGRLDINGTLCFFDVNGLPALCFPEGVMVKQCFSCFPDYAKMEVYTGLLHTIVHNALMRNSFVVPRAAREHNLFTMRSEFAIKVKKSETKASAPALMV